MAGLASESRRCVKQQVTMKRFLITQMRNEWRSNIWMVIELTVVSLILWYLFAAIWSLVNVSLRERGYDVDDLYMGEFHLIGEESPFYQPYDSVHSPTTDAAMLLSKLRANPYVEIVGSGMGIGVYDLCYFGMALSVDSVEYHGNLRYADPDAIRAYRLKSHDGHTTEQLAQIIERGELIVSTPDKNVAYDFNDPSRFVDRDVILGGDSAAVYHVAAVAFGLRRSDYEPQSGVIYAPMPPKSMPSEVVIRVAAGRGRDFLSSLSRDDRSAGNVYLANLQSADDRREVAQLGDSLKIRNFLICASFLLAVIFLGFLGTFWFRTQQRVEEIAIRMVNGASRGDIFRRFISEGLMLLLVATLIAVPIELLIVGRGILTDLLETYSELTLSSPEIYQAMAMSFCLLALLIVAGIWFPALRAMKLNPAGALKDQ